MNLADLAELGITASISDDDKLILDLPKGAINPELTAELRRSKPALMAELAAKRECVNLVNLPLLCLSPAGEVCIPKSTFTPTDMAPTSRWWLIHYPDRDPVEVACCPEATHADILERHPDAVAAEPFAPTIRQPSSPLTASEKTAIRAWLALIEETDPATIAEVIGMCQRDADAREYFTGRAAHL